MKVVDEVKKLMGFQSKGNTCKSCTHCWYVEKPGGIDVYKCQLNPAVHFDIDRPNFSSCNHYEKEQKT